MLIATGLLMFGFVAYQLWGTGIETARAQKALENEFEELLTATTTPAPRTTEVPATTIPETIPETTVPETTVPESVPGAETSEPATSVPATSEPVPFAIEEGDPIARLEMPSIGVDNIVVAGVTKADLKKGPGHYPETPMPGQLGNTAIAGHRTTYGQPFHDVDELEVGDEIVLTTLAGRFVYRVTGQQIVSPDDYQVVTTTDPTRATITLTSCHPKYTARQRIVITGELDVGASTSEAADPVINYGRPLDGAVDEPDDDVVDEPVVTDPTSTLVEEQVEEDVTVTSEPAAATSAPEDTAAPEDSAVNAEIADAFADGWFSDPGAPAQVALWGLALAAVGALSTLVSRRAKRDWVGLLVGLGPFLVVLYFFFQNVNRLLPPNL